MAAAAAGTGAGTMSVAGMGTMGTSPAGASGA